MINARTDEAYRGWQIYVLAGMSHTVTSRELVRQVPLTAQICAASLGDFAPLIPLLQKEG